MNLRRFINKTSLIIFLIILLIALTFLVYKYRSSSEDKEVFEQDHDELFLDDASGGETEYFENEGLPDNNNDNMPREDNYSVPGGMPARPSQRDQGDSEESYDNSPPPIQEYEEQVEPTPDIERRYEYDFDPPLIDNELETEDPLDFDMELEDY